MPSPTSPAVQQFGMSTQGGALANLVDGDLATFWQPYADGFDSYPTPPVSDAGLVVVGAVCPAIQFDFGEAVRIPVFRVITETAATLGWTWLLASDNSATSVNDTCQAGDIYAGRYTVHQMNLNRALETFAKTQSIRKRFWRFVFFKNPASGDVDNWPAPQPLGPPHSNTYYETYGKT